MEKTLQQLAELLLGAVPTFVLVLFLYLFLKKVFFNPLERLMHERYEQTEGAMNSAAASIAAAEQKTAEYQQALREARAEVFRHMEAERQRTLEENQQVIRQARAQAEERLRQARAEIRADVDAARTQLRQESEEMAEAVVRAVLPGRLESAV